MQSSALGWTLIRVFFGLNLSIAYGREKLFGGIMQPFTEAVGALGFPFPGFFAWCAGLSEFVGGILVAIGFLTRPAAAVASVTMMVAIYSNYNGTFLAIEPPLHFLVVMLTAVLVGGGPFSLDARLLPRLLPSKARAQTQGT